MSKMLRDILSDAECLSMCIKNLEEMGDALLLEADGTNRSVESLRQFQVVSDTLNRMSSNQTNAEMIERLKKKSDENIKIMQENHALSKCIEDYTSCTEFIMQKYREHTSGQVMSANNGFKQVHDEQLWAVIHKQREKIEEMAAVMQYAAAADADDEGINLDLEIINRLRMENKAMREQLQLTNDFGKSYYTPLTANKSIQTGDSCDGVTEKGVQTERAHESEQSVQTENGAEKSVQTDAAMMICKSVQTGPNLAIEKGIQTPQSMGADKNVLTAHAESIVVEKAAVVEKGIRTEQEAVDVEKVKGKEKDTVVAKQTIGKEKCAQAKHVVVAKKIMGVEKSVQTRQNSANSTAIGVQTEVQFDKAYKSEKAVVAEKSVQTFVATAVEIGVQTANISIFSSFTDVDAEQVTDFLYPNSENANFAEVLYVEDNLMSELSLSEDDLNNSLTPFNMSPNNTVVEIVADDEVSESVDFEEFLDCKMVLSEDEE